MQGCANNALEYVHVHKDSWKWRRGGDVNKVWTCVYRHTAMVQYLIKQKGLYEGSKTWVLFINGSTSCL